jgi:4-aminobutyrate aminotransferase-like enzyme
MGMTLTGKTGVYKQSFGPFAPEVYHTPYPYPYRGWTTERALEALGDLFRTVVAPDRVAAIVIEPVLGEGGFVAASPDFLRALRRVADERGMLLIADEIQCGMGRTGALWAHERIGVRPDVMTVAKGLGGGLPVGACVTNPDTAGVLGPGDHGSTFAGGPVIAAAANAVLDVVTGDGFLDTVRERSRQLAAGLHDLGLEPRGAGLMVGFDLPDAPGLARRLLLEQRLVVHATGPETIRMLPPLTVSAAEVDDALSRLGAGLG